MVKTKKKITSKKKVKKSSVVRKKPRAKKVKQERKEELLVNQENIFDSEVGKTDTLFIDSPQVDAVAIPAILDSQLTPEILPQEKKKPWWKKLFSI